MLEMRYKATWIRRQNFVCLIIGVVLPMFKTGSLIAFARQNLSRKAMLSLLAQRVLNGREKNLTWGLGKKLN